MIGSRTVVATAPMTIPGSEFSKMSSNSAMVSSAGERLDAPVGHIPAHQLLGSDHESDRGRF
jgi:hypothetical protein